MITIWLWFNVARADSFEQIVREKVALLQIVHRAESKNPLTMDDPDRALALELLADTTQRGAVFNLLQTYGDVATTGDGRRSLRRALRRDGYDGDATRLRRQLQLELLGAATEYRVMRSEVVDEVRKHILVHSPMSRRFQTWATNRAHADLVTLLGQLGAPEGVNVALHYLRGLAAAWDNVENISHYHQAAEAVRALAPKLAPRLIAGAIGAPEPDAEPEPKPAPPRPRPPTTTASLALDVRPTVPACAKRLTVARRLGAALRSLFRRPRPT